MLGIVSMRCAAVCDAAHRSAVCASSIQADTGAGSTSRRSAEHWWRNAAALLLQASSLPWLHTPFQALAKQLQTDPAMGQALVASFALTQYFYHPFSWHLRSSEPETGGPVRNRASIQLHMQPALWGQPTAACLRQTPLYGVPAPLRQTRHWLGTQSLCTTPVGGTQTHRPRWHTDTCGWHTDAVTKLPIDDSLVATGLSGSN